MVSESSTEYVVVGDVAVEVSLLFNSLSLFKVHWLQLGSEDLVSFSGPVDLSYGRGVCVDFSRVKMAQ